MFLQVSVILFTGGVPGPGGAWSGGCLVWGGAWSRRVPGLGGAWSERVPAPRGVPAPWGGSGPRGCLVEIPPDSYCCGQYVSYWNAFLFKKHIPKRP